jgi:hypothetical protein
MVNQLLQQCFTLCPAAFFRSHISETTAYPISLIRRKKGHAAELEMRRVLK